MVDWLLLSVLYMEEKVEKLLVSLPVDTHNVLTLADRFDMLV